MRLDGLEGKVAVVTGAASGIGRAVALRFADQGASVVAIDRTLDESQEVIDKIQHSGGQAASFLADVSKPEEVKWAIDAAVQKFGRIDIVLANAGINGVWASIEELSIEDWDTTINTNLRGTFATIKYAVPYLKQQGGAIVVTASVNGTRIFSNSGATAYSCSKAAQVAMTKMLAVELAKYKIRVNVVCPGAIETNIDQSTEHRDLEAVQEPVKFPEGKIPLTDGTPGTSDQVAQLVLFLSSNAASHITGTEVWIDGAESLLKG